MPANISKRAFIHWLPDKPEETTSTLVLTSHEGRFVDLRLIKPLKTGETISEGQLDWAFAGTSTTRPATGDQHGLKNVSKKQYSKFVDDLDAMDEPLDARMMHTIWTHTVDSRHQDTTNVSDEGDMLFDEDLGMVLEAGSMVNPATGKPTDYREGWIDVDVEPPTTCVVLELHAPNASGMVVRLGQWLQAVARSGTDFSLQRWRLIEDDWILHATMGPAKFPVEVAANDDVTIGTVYDMDGPSGQAWQWKVVESSSV